MKKSSRMREFGLPAFLVALAWYALMTASFGSPFIVSTWGVEEGLPDSEAVSLAQTRDGYLWIGTLHGLARFDGDRFTVFNQMNTPGLTSDQIVFLFEDSAGNLWAGTDAGGLLRIREGMIKNFGEPAGGGKILAAQQEGPGDILFATSGGVIRYHDGRMNFYGGVASPLLAGLASRSIVPSKAGGFWEMLNGPVEEWRRSRLARNAGLPPWGNAIITSACEDSRTNLIVGTLGKGVFWLDSHGHWRNVSTNQGLSSPFVLSLCMDREGGLWVGTDSGGLDRIKPKTFDTSMGIPTRSVQSLSRDDAGGWWMASGALGLSYWNTNGLRQYHIGPLQDAWEVLADQRRQTVWVGTRDQGLFKLQDNQFVPVQGSSILGPQIFALFQDGGGNLWVGCRNGLGKFDGQEWTLFTTRNGLSGNAVTAIGQDESGTLWIGTEGAGADALKDGKFTSWRAAEGGLPGDDISCLYAARNATVWAGTFGHGLARFKGGKWESFSTQMGLASDSISYITGDAEGYLWIGSVAGLMRVREQSLDDVAAGRAKTVFCRTYGKADGLPTRECSAGSEPSVCGTADGRLWFPTIQGVASLNPATLRPNLERPTLMIERILVDGREMKTNRLASAWPEKIEIGPGGDQSRDELEIDYTALDFSEPKLVRFKYRLAGYQGDWTPAGSERVARYPKLPPGDYDFQAAAINEDGIENTNAVSLRVIVLPAFWQTWRFRGGGLILLLGIVVLIVRYLSTQKLQRQLEAHRQREALEGERARIARDLHDQLGANLTQVALLGEMAEADKNAPEEIESHARQISQTARETTGALDEIVWAVNPANDTLEGLASYAFKYAQEFFSLAGVRCRVDAPAELPTVSIPPEVRHNVFLAFKEAVNNVVKHAQATEAQIRLRLQPGRLDLEIADDGRGLPAGGGGQDRSGLRNMRRRMEEIGGEFSIGSQKGGGAAVRLTAPIARTI
ncbi:MAG: hypothetical protein KGJ88_12085 [Verrucomicrobiota bacterium]|nr:hypothetical protein [Verrucomicrobiota bacterium]